MGEGGIKGAGECSADIGEFCISDEGEGLVMEGDCGVVGPIPSGVPGPEALKAARGELTDRGEVCTVGAPGE